MEDYILLSIPLYILLGEILVRSARPTKCTARSRCGSGVCPAGLLHTNVGASAMFSAVSGSSVSTAATIATVALPSFRRRNYDDRLVLESIAAGASLGNLIPPGIAFIVYASLTNTSVGQLYAAALIPSIMMTVLFMLTIIGAALVRPDLAAKVSRASRCATRLRLVDLSGRCIVFVIIMGSVYTGWATVTESAALAVVATIGIARFNRRCSIAHAARLLLATRQSYGDHNADPGRGLLPQLRLGPAGHHTDAQHLASEALIRPPT